MQFNNLTHWKGDQNIIKNSKLGPLHPIAALWCSLINKAGHKIPKIPTMPPMTTCLGGRENPLNEKSLEEIPDSLN